MLWQLYAQSESYTRQRCSNSIGKRLLDIVVELCRARLVLERKGKVSHSFVLAPKPGKQQ